MACLNYTLKNYCDNNGNSSIAKETLYNLLDDALGFKNETHLYENAVIQMLASEEIYETTHDRYSPSMLYYLRKKL